MWRALLYQQVRVSVIPHGDGEHWRIVACFRYRGYCCNIRSSLLIDAGHLDDRLWRDQARVAVTDLLIGGPNFGFIIATVTPSNSLRGLSPIVFELVLLQLYA